MRKKNRIFLFKTLVILAAILLCLSALALLSMSSADEYEPELECGVLNSGPIPPGDRNTWYGGSFGFTSLSWLSGGNVPTSEWTYGCTATSAGMLFGYYDRIGYVNMYTGPTNGGVAPSSDLGQGVPGNPRYPITPSTYMIATENGVDGIAQRAHVDDYWIGPSGTAGPDPWVTWGWNEHTWSLCTADFLGTNQWKWDYNPYPNNDGLNDANDDGTTYYWYNTDGSRLYNWAPTGSGAGGPYNVGPGYIPAAGTSCCVGCRLFAESRGYAVTTNYDQLTDTPMGHTSGSFPAGQGFTFNDYKNEIDNGYPVLTQWRGYSTMNGWVGHTMIGVGYDDSYTPPRIYFHDTWDNLLHWTTWDGTYSTYNLELNCVTIIHLDQVHPQVYKEHPEHGYLPEIQEKVAVVPAPWQYWTQFVGGVTDIIIWDPPEPTDPVAIVRDYAVLDFQIELENLTWDGTDDLPWINIDYYQPYILYPNEQAVVDIPTTEYTKAVIVRYSVAWAEAPYQIEAHFINEVLLESYSPQVITGSLSNFDVHNFLDIPVDNFELELYGIQPSDVTGWYYDYAVPQPFLVPTPWGPIWYGGWGNSPHVTPLPTMDGIEVKWIEVNHPAHYCEWVHFGLELKPTAQPWGVKAYWTKIISPPLLKLCAPITLWAEDLPIGSGSGVEGIYYGFWYNGSWYPRNQFDIYGGNWNITMYKYYRWWYTYTNPIHFHEECIHKLHYWAQDNAGNLGPVYKQVYYVDGTPPTITKSHPDPCYYPINQTASIINVGGRIILEAEDGGTEPCIAGVEAIYYGFWYNGDWYPRNQFDIYCGNWNITKYEYGKWWYTYSHPIQFHEECKHVLEYWTKDLVCNTRPVFSQIYWVNDCKDEVWIDDDFKSDTPGWLHSHFRTKQMALDWLGPGGTAYVYDGIYDEDISIDDVPCCDNTGITQKGEYGCFPITESAVIIGTETIKVNEVTIKYLEYTPNTNGAIIVEPNIFGTFLRCNKFRRDCVADAIGVNALGNSNVNAELNWWGAPDGPNGGIMDDGKLANGLGVKVLGNVFVEPWIGIHAEIAEPIGTIEVKLGTPVTFDSTGSFAYTYGECCQEPKELPLQYLWDFGDGLQSANMITTHIFEQTGTYLVTLMVDSEGIPGLYSNFMYDWAYVTIHVTTEDTTLTANADGGNLGGYETIVNEPLQLKGDAYGGNGEYTWHWNFGDQTADSNLQNPIHTYTKPGIYTTTLTVISDGETATDTAQVRVYDIDELFVTINDANAIAGIETMFAASIKGGTPPYSISWDFGDGITSQENSPTHIYNNPGEYTITVKVTDDKQKTATDTATITVEEDNIIEEAEIKDVNGGLGVKATIDAGESNCDWEITVEGKVFLGGENSGIIYANTQETVKLGFSIAIGDVDIIVKAEDIEKRYTAFALGPLFLNLQEI